MWDLPGPGLEPVSPALAGRFLTTAPPRKPQEYSCKQKIYLKNQQVNIFLQNGNSFLSLKDMCSSHEYKENAIVWNPTTQENLLILCVFLSASYTAILTLQLYSCGDLLWKVRFKDVNSGSHHLVNGSSFCCWILLTLDMPKLFLSGVSSVYSSPWCSYCIFITYFPRLLGKSLSLLFFERNGRDSYAFIFMNKVIIISSNSKKNPWNC